MNKKIIASLFIGFLVCAGSFAQQITKFGVVDTNKVYNAYFKNTTAVRNYEKKRADFQQEINKVTEQIRELQQKKLDYQNENNQAMVMKTETEITKKKDYLNEYTNAKNVELDSMLKSLKSSDEFYKKLYNALSKIAESGGYSMILSLQESNAILWYSNTVDITDEVISKLGL
ncbi:MAG: OmpH family outer membrane protein [Treponema sp.]|nr:OmpH family outer membrane protein [Treponema sp.]